MKKSKPKKSARNIVRYAVRRSAIRDQAVDYVESFAMFENDITRFIGSMSKTIDAFEALYNRACVNKKSVSRKELVRDTEFLMTDFNDALNGIRETTDMFFDLTGEIEDSFLGDIQRRSEVNRDEY